MIMNVKRNGIFRARLVACGYIQVPDVNLNVSTSPAINDVNFRVLLIAKLVWNMKATNIDIENVFIYGNLDEEIYMEIQPGLNFNDNQKFLLHKQSTVYFRVLENFAKMLLRF
jgi:hypothetical protein